MRPHDSAPSPPARAAAPPGASPGEVVGPFELTLTAERDAPAKARAAVTAWMVGHVAETMLADVQLLVTELVTNSVRHADTADDAVVSVKAEILGDALHLQVEDRGSSGSIARRTPDLQNGGGFGLNMVEELSRCWGVERSAGTRVWAEIAARAPASIRAADREPAARPEGDGETDTDARHVPASAAALRANGGRRRAVAARHPGESAATGHVQHRVADPHALVARHDERPRARCLSATTATPTRHDHVDRRSDAAGGRATHAARRAVHDVEVVIHASDLSADERSALRLLGSSYVHPRAQRRQANAHLSRFTGPNLRGRSHAVDIPASPGDGGSRQRRSRATRFARRRRRLRAAVLGVARDTPAPVP